MDNEGKEEKEIGKREKKSRRKTRNKFKTKPVVFQRALQRKPAKEGVSVLTVLDELEHVYKLIASEGIEKTVATTEIQNKKIKA